jgi:hypothetical protein
VALNINITRRHFRKGYSHCATYSPHFSFWQPRLVNWWIGLLFMIGAGLFATACLIDLQVLGNGYSALYYASGSVFFTAAAYLQFFQSINAYAPLQKGYRYFVWHPMYVSYWVTFTQFIGTLMFNLNTFSGLFSMSTQQYDMYSFAPNWIGSILFQISGCLVFVEIKRATPSYSIEAVVETVVCWINFFGCVAFLLSVWAISPINTTALAGNKTAVILTLLGAICFFVASALLWLEIKLHATHTGDVNKNSGV